MSDKRDYKEPPVFTVEVDIFGKEYTKELVDKWRKAFYGYHDGSAIGIVPHIPWSMVPQKRDLVTFHFFEKGTEVTWRKNAMVETRKGNSHKACHIQVNDIIRNSNNKWEKVIRIEKNYDECDCDGDCDNIDSSCVCGKCDAE